MQVGAERVPFFEKKHAQKNGGLVHFGLQKELLMIQGCRWTVANSAERLWLWRKCKEHCSKSASELGVLKYLSPLKMINSEKLLSKVRAIIHDRIILIIPSPSPLRTFGCLHLGTPEILPATSPPAPCCRRAAVRPWMPLSPRARRQATARGGRRGTRKSWSAWGHPRRRHRCALAESHRWVEGRVKRPSQQKWWLFTGKDGEMVWSYRMLHIFTAYGTR